MRSMAEGFLLRPKNNFYHLVGECYVHGIMDGEAITMLEARQLSEASFEYPIALHLVLFTKSSKGKN